jgi:hypothetical protein
VPLPPTEDAEKEIPARAGKFVGFWFPKASLAVSVRLVEDPETRFVVEAFRMLIDAT